jgi:hypothetical protein
LLLLYVIASLVFLAVFYFIFGSIISLSVGVLLKFASDNMDRPLIIGTLLDPVVSYQLTIQIHPVTTQAIVIIFGFLHCLPALAFEGGVSIIPNTVTVTHFDRFR